MDDIRKLLKDAQEKMLQADHLTFSTYPQVQEPKLLALIVEDTNVILLNCMQAFLSYERMYKRIGPVKGDFNSELLILKNQLKRYGLDAGIAQTIMEVKNLAEKKKVCPMEFRKRDSYLLCSDDYKIDSLDIRAVKKYVTDARKLLDKAVEVLK